MKKEQKPEPQHNSDSIADNSQVSPTCPKPIVVGSLVSQREIKFRAWDKWLKKFYYDTNVLHVSVNKIFYDCGISGWQISNAHCEFMQYTGLKDKNGKEIYEGDITKNFNCGPHKVVFENGAFGYIINNDEDYPYFISFAGNNNFKWDGNSSDRIEKVGNIFENPELLQTLR